MVADRLSRAAEGTPPEEGDGSEWTVSEDWEATARLTHDLFHIADKDSEEVTVLRERFKDVPMLLEVVDVHQTQSGHQLAETEAGASPGL